MNDLLINTTATLKEALSQLDSTHQGVLFLVDITGRLIRVVTDGDIRRLLLKDISLDTTLAALPAQPPKWLPASASAEDAYLLMDEHTVDHIPIVDDAGKPIRFIHRRDMSPNILLSTPHIGDYEQTYVQEAFTTNWVAPLGPNVDAFEKEVAAYLNVNAAVALISGTAALHLALVLLNVQRDDIVFCSTFTFVASANAILYQSATPIFIDSEFDSWNMSPVALKRALIEAQAKQQLPKAVIVVNLYGQSANYDEICDICEAFNVPIIEDAAESLGATYKNKPSGTFGKFGIFSFNGNKIITTSGGGLLISNDSAVIEKARFLATQARDPAPHYEHSVIGYNYRMSNILAGVGRGQLKVLETRVAARQAIYQRYKEALTSHPAITMMPEIALGQSTHWLSTLLLNPAYTSKRPMDVINYLKQHHIEARRTWKPMHQQPLFSGSTYYAHDDAMSVSDYLFEYGLCLPSGSNLTNHDVDRVIQCVLKSLEPHKLVVSA